jgi:hypothetical protein
VVEAGSVEDAIGGQGLKAAEMERIRALGEDKTEEDRARCFAAEENEALELLTASTGCRSRRGAVALHAGSVLHDRAHVQASAGRAADRRHL